MINKESLRVALLLKLGEQLNVMGFTLNKSQSEFKKTLSLGWEKYQIVFLKREFGWELKPSLLLRIDKIENIFHEISGFEEKYKNGTHTIGISIEDYLHDGNKYRYSLTHENQVDEISRELFNVFNKVALPFFEKYSSLAAIEEVLNQNPYDTSLTGSIFKGYKTIIMAKLMQRNNFNDLVNIYQKYYSEFSNGFYLPEYEKLVEVLQFRNS